jgi:hypothetical protein
MTTQGHEPLSVWLRPGDNRLLQGVPWLLKLLALFLLRIPPALKLVGDQALLRGDLLVLFKGTSRFLRDLLHLAATCFGGCTLRRLLRLGRFATGV